MMANTSFTSSGDRPMDGSSIRIIFGPRHQRAADRQHLLLAAGEIAGEPGALLQAREIVEDHVDVGIDLAVAAGEGAEPQILQRGHVGDDAAALHHLEDAAADDLVGIDAVDALAVEQDLAAGDLAVLGLEQAGDRLQRGRFARAVGAQQRHDRALGHFEAQAAQHQDHVVIDHLDVVHAEQRGGGGDGGRARAWLLRRFGSCRDHLLAVVTRESG